MGGLQAVLQDMTSPQEAYKLCCEHGELPCCGGIRFPLDGGLSLHAEERVLLTYSRAMKNLAEKGVGIVPLALPSWSSLWTI